jgi:hypothetical protein
MRDYSKVSGSFWTGKTGKSMRGNLQTQIVALYLMTSPHANMIGVFNCPVEYIAHETGSPLEGAMQGLEKLQKDGFCTFDGETDTVWVHEMAKFQIGDELKPTDNRVKDIQKQYSALPEGLIKKGFFDKYSAAYNLVKKVEGKKPPRSPSKAPSKPEAGTGAEAGTGTEITLQTFLDSCKANGDKAIRDEDPIFEYAKKIGLPEYMLFLGWTEFKSLQAEDKLQIDWRATFRNYVKKGWLKSWAINKDGEYYLSLLGKQLEKELNGEPA